MQFLAPLVFLCVGLAAGQYSQPHTTTTPVPILKQIDRHNEDGSYSYGYEAADGSYKIESKFANGEVFGKYGFVDDTGNVREIEYGATHRGFEPAGTGINVPPSTLSGNNIAGPNDPEDDGQYREDPSIYYTDPKYTNGERYKPRPKYQQQAARPAAYNPATAYKPAPAPAYNPASAQAYNPAPAQAYNPAPAQAYNPAPAPAYNAAPAPAYNPAPVQAYNPAQQSYSSPAYNSREPVQSHNEPQYQAQYEQPQYQDYASSAPEPQSRYQNYPVNNYDTNTGSHSVNYRR